MRITLILILFSFLFNNIYADSTGTVLVPELTQEQIDWIEILELNTDYLMALKLAKQNEKFDYLRNEINTRQAVFELNKEQKARNIKLGRGYFGHIYPCHINNRIKKIELEDSND